MYAKVDRNLTAVPASSGQWLREWLVRRYLRLSLVESGGAFMASYLARAAQAATATSSRSGWMSRRSSMAARSARVNRQSKGRAVWL